MECRLERQRQWAIRMMHEASMHEHNSFVTLTYSNANLPFAGNLELRDWQLFAKRLRKAGFKFQFYQCAEYGEKYRRPHFHAALFGLDFHHDRKFLQEQKGNRYYTSKTLTDHWGLGNVVLGDLTFESASYVAGYITKKLNGQKAANLYRTIDPFTGEVHELRAPFSSMSKKPAIGKSWYNKFKRDVYPRDSVVARGQLSKPPRYYDRLHAETAPEEMEQIKLDRSEQLRASGLHITKNTYQQRRARYLRHSKRRAATQREPELET